MPEENKKPNNTDVDTGAAPEPPQAAVASQPQEPVSFDLADDILQLEKLNLMRALMLRLQGGKHPIASTDALLKRRMAFPGLNFQGPYAVRFVCTLMMIFVMACLLWAVLWGIAVSLELSYFVKLISTGFATVVAAMAGVAIFHPSSIPDEKLVRAAIKDRLEDLRKQLEAQNAPPVEETKEESDEESEEKSEEKSVAGDAAVAADSSASASVGASAVKNPAASANDAIAGQQSSDPINEALALEGSDDIVT